MFIKIDIDVAEMKHNGILLMNDLTDKQAMFCKEYMVDLNATQAAIRAGYSEHTANVIGPENLAKPCIQEVIQKLMEKRSNKIELTAEYILNNIIEIGNRCMQKTRVMVREGKVMVPKQEYAEDENGDEQLCDVWEFKEGGALKAQELLGKHLKLFIDKERSDVNLNMNFFEGIVRKNIPEEILDKHTDE